MQKKFFSNLTFLVLINILIKPIWLFGIDRTVQNTIGPSEYGIFFVLFNLSYMLQIILDMGISNFNIKNIAQHEHLLSKYFPNIIIVRLLLSFVFIGLVFLVALLLHYDDYMLKLLWVVAFNQVLASAILYLRSNLAGLQLHRINSVFSVFDRFLMILICSVLLWGNVMPEPFKLAWFIYAQTAALSFATMLAFFLVLARTTKFKLNWNFPFLLLILRQSFPFALFGFLTVIHTRVDAVMIQAILKDGDGVLYAGIYAASFRFMDASFMIAFLFATLLLPIFSRMLAKNEAVGPLAKLCFQILVIPGILICIALYFHRIEVMNSLYYHAVDEYYMVFGLLVFTFIPIATSYIYGTLLTANGNLRALGIIAVCGVILNFTLNFILIKQFQATGAALATLITQYLVVLAQIIVVMRIFKLKISIGMAFAFVVFLVSSISLNFLLKGYFDNWIINFGIILIISTIIGFLLQLIDIKPLFKLTEGDQT